MFCLISFLLRLLPQVLFLCFQVFNNTLELDVLVVSIAAIIGQTQEGVRFLESPELCGMQRLIQMFSKSHLQFHLLEVFDSFLDVSCHMSSCVSDATFKIGLKTV
jgi:hypothetical protein